MSARNGSGGHPSQRLQPEFKVIRPVVYVGYTEAEHSGDGSAAAKRIWSGGNAGWVAGCS